MLEGDRDFTYNLPDIDEPITNIIKENFYKIPSELPTSGDINKGSAEVGLGYYSPTSLLQATYDTTKGGKIEGQHEFDTVNIGKQEWTPVVEGSVKDTGETGAFVGGTTLLGGNYKFPITVGIQKDYGENFGGYIGTTLPLNYKKGGLLDRKKS